MKESIVEYVCLDEKGLDSLERQLAIEMSKLTPKGYQVLRGPKGDEKVQVPEQRELREIVSEIKEENSRLKAKISSQAESHPLIELFEEAKVKLPPVLRVDHDKMHYDFYLVEVTFRSPLSSDLSLLSAELELILTDDVDNPVRRARPIHLFPERKNIQLFNVKIEGAIGIDAGMGISVPVIGSEVLPWAEVDADAKLKAQFVFGPLRYEFFKAAIEVVGKGDQHIMWRYDFESELREKNEFDSYLILKIAEEARSVQMSGFIRVVPYKLRWKLFKDALQPYSSHEVPLPVELKPRKEE